MKLGDVLGKVVDVAGAAVKVAGPVAAGFAAGGPVGAGLAVAGQLSGAGTKRAGVELEIRKNAPPVHKAAAPVAAVGVPTVLAVLLAQLGVDGADRLAQFACTDNAAAGGAVAGMLAWVSHQAGRSAQKATRRR